jgi:hypothetical protein
LQPGWNVTMSKVKIYKYTTYHSKRGEQVVSKRMGTRAFIEMVNGTVIEGTEMEVDSSKVSHEGMTELGFMDE